MEIQTLFKEAKEAVLKDGHHLPVVFVETSNESFELPFIDVDPLLLHTLQNQQHLLFALGQALTLGHGVTLASLQAIFLVSECWLADERGSLRASTVLPAGGAERKAIMVLALHPQRATEEAQIAEIINAGMTIVDLAPLSHKQVLVPTLLPYLLAGVGLASNELDETALAALLRQYLS